MLRKFVDGRVELRRYPPWVPPEVMRERFLHLLHLSDSGGLGSEQIVSNMVLQAERDGSYSWLCGLEGDKPRRAPRGGWSIQHGAIVNVLFGYLSQWCLQDVVDARGRAVPPEERMVLDPDFVLKYLEHGGKTLQSVLRDAPLVELKPGKWRDRQEVVAWRLSLAVWAHRKPLRDLSEALDRLESQLQNTSAAMGRHTTST